MRDLKVSSSLCRRIKSGCFMMEIKIIFPSAPNQRRSRLRGLNSYKYIEMREGKPLFCPQIMRRWANLAT